MNQSLRPWVVLGLALAASLGTLGARAQTSAPAARSTIDAALDRKAASESQFLSPDDAFKVVAETGKPLMRDLPIQATHLGMEWVLLRAVRLDGGIAITAADITQNKRTEARLLKLTQANAGNSQ